MYCSQPTRFTNFFAYTIKLKNGVHIFNACKQQNKLIKNYLIRMVLLSLLIDIENKTGGLIFVASVLN